MDLEYDECRQPNAQWSKGSPNAPNHLVSIEFNGAPHQQFDEVAEELKRKERETVSYMRNGVFAFFEGGRHERMRDGGEQG